MRLDARSRGPGDEVHLNRHVELAILRQMSPSTHRVMTPVFLDVPPQRRETLTPAQARERYGYDRPAEAHADWRERQRARVFVEAVARATPASSSPRSCSGR